MIEDTRKPDKYGVETVVGDIHSEYVPTAINRTILEHTQLISVFTQHIRKPFIEPVAEFGCGYGRMLPFLFQITGQGVHGFEQDDELRGIAERLCPWAYLKSFDGLSLPLGIFPFVLTYTFMQHLNEREWSAFNKLITCAIPKGGYWLMVERDKRAPWGFELVHAEPRIKEATNPNVDVGTLWLLRKA